MLRLITDILTETNWGDSCIFENPSWHFWIQFESMSSIRKGAVFKRLVLPGLLQCGKQLCFQNYDQRLYIWRRLDEPVQIFHQGLSVFVLLFFLFMINCWFFLIMKPFAILTDTLKKSESEAISKKWKKAVTWISHLSWCSQNLAFTGNTLLWSVNVQSEALIFTKHPSRLVQPSVERNWSALNLFCLLLPLLTVTQFFSLFVVKETSFTCGTLRAYVCVRRCVCVCVCDNGRG